MKNLVFSPIISNGMIMQRDKPFIISFNKKTTVSFIGKKYETIKNGDKWLITLDPVTAGGPYEMEIQSDNHTTVIKDIYYGDVWLCSGQSNMEMQMDRLRDDFGEEWDLSNFNELNLIRQFKVSQECDFTSERDELNQGSWLCASSQNLHEFSAVAWFFAKKLYEKYRVPIGLINTAWGGTPIESWMSIEALSSFPQKIKEGTQYVRAKTREDITNKTAAAIEKWHTELYHNDTGIINEWFKPDTDISSWDEMNLPGNFSDNITQDLKNFCGSIWLTKEFEATSLFASQKTRVWLGTIVDADTVYINGTEIGNTGYRYPPRKYIPNDLIKQGKNRIVIRVTCVNGEGGVTKDKPFCIFTDTETIELKGSWKYKIGAKTNERPMEFFFQRQPMGNFNAMISPVLKFPLKGVIWYQGESNDPNSHEYEKLFKLMILDWRAKNKDENLPFLFVQLPIWKDPSYNEENASWAIIREAQKNALLLPYTGMACALELGEYNDIHPINKKDIGYRLFLAAEKIVFGCDNSSPGPLINRYEIKQDNLLIYFDNCANGLKLQNDGTNTYTDKSIYISLINDEGKLRLPAVIKGKDCIHIDISSVTNTNPKKILYAWADNPIDRQLFNSDGLPALPFKLEIALGDHNV